MDENLNIALATGFVIDDRYVIEGVLGDGGFGIVYRAWDRTFETRVAIKEFLPREVSTRASDAVSVVPRSKGEVEVHAEGVKAFLEEARRVHRLDHENIVEITDFVHAHGTGYLVMPYYNGETLSQFLRRGETLSSEEIADLTEQVLSALEYVHDRDLLHRDISPGNLFLKKDGTVLLIDFGASRQVVGERSRSLSTIVKPGYAPFEQYHTTGNQGPWTDLYSLGATLYRCVTGEPPPVATERLDAVTDSRPDPNLMLAGSEYQGRFSSAILSLIDRLLALRASARPQSVASARKLMPPTADRTGARPNAGPRRERPLPPQQPSPHDPRSRSPPRKRPTRFARAAIAAAVLAIVGLALFTVLYYLPFGDNLSPRANNGECSDPTFTGPGMAEEVLLDDHRHDAADCFSLYWADRVDFLPAFGATLTVSSTPGSAEVSVNGTYVGVTPLVTEVDPGAIYSVEAVLDGFETQTRPIEIEQIPITLDAWNRSLHFELAPIVPQAAALVVRSNVADDALFIDGRAVGSTGPERHEVGGGDHLVRVTKEYYADWSQAVTLAPGEERTLVAELVLIPDSCQFANDNACDEPGLCPIGTDTTDCAVIEPVIEPVVIPATLAVTSDPPSAQVFVDGDYLGMTPLESVLDPGEYLVSVTRSDGYYTDWVSPLTLTENEERTLAVELVLIPDSCQYANDNECDEPGICPIGTDTTDCAVDPANSCTFAFDDECDEPGLCAIGTDTADCSAADASNSCRWAFDNVCDEPDLCAIGTDTADCGVIDSSNSCTWAFDDMCDEPGLCTVDTDTADCDAFFGDDSSTWANDGECDDPRFQGEGMAMTLFEEDRGRDATDCRNLYNAGSIWER